VSFGGITGQANTAAVQSDLDSNSRKLQLYYTQYGSYPTALDGSNCPTAPTADTNYCLKASTGTTLTYQGTSADYSLYGTKGSTIYKTSSTAAPFQTKLTSPCPSGFIVVPGSTTYGTSDFCVMKYEAKCALTASPTEGLSTQTNWYANSATACTSANSRGLVSVASGAPVVAISQSTASTYATSAIGCTGCALISEAQWLTITQNVLSNPTNWSNNSVGSGYIYSGHNDGSPLNPLSAGDDSNGYYGTGNTSGNQRRTLVLTNVEVIWDLSGNIREWTSGQNAGGQPNGGASYAWREWTAVTGGTMSPSPYPSTTGLTGASTWTSANGIGMVYSASGTLTNVACSRGGMYIDSSNAGLMALMLEYQPTDAGDWSRGFRVAR